MLNSSNDVLCSAIPVDAPTEFSIFIKRTVVRRILNDICIQRRTLVTERHSPSIIKFDCKLILTTANTAVIQNFKDLPRDGVVVAADTGSFQYLVIFYQFSF